MLVEVFIDLRYFLAFYSFVNILFGLIFTLLEIPTSDGTSTEDYYNGFSLAGYYVMAFRASTGDFQVDNYNQMND